MSSVNEERLAIVIPAYGADYLPAALDSLGSQTCREFVVLVADDASPADILGVVNEHSGGLDLRYVRFETNLGGRELTAHWNRAVRSTNAAWVMLMGDDDELDPGVVDCFYAALRETQGRFDLYRFNTRRIDGAGVVRLINTDQPLLEGAVEFVNGRFREERSPYTCAHIFRRSAWERIGGFVSFPLAWCSDDATWAALGLEKGIYTMVGPRASWRLSGKNISSRHPDTALRKLYAQCAYLRWLTDNLGAAPGQRWDAAVGLRLAAANWFHVGLWRSECYIPFSDAVRLTREVNRFTRLGFLNHLARFLKHDWEWLRSHAQVCLARRLRVRCDGDRKE